MENRKKGIVIGRNTGNLFAEILKKGKANLLDFLYPRRCPLCGEIADSVCDRCTPKLIYASEPLCYRCGKPLESWEREFCGDCREHTHWFHRGKGLFLYRDPVKESIHKIKYSNKREYLDYYAREMVKKLGRDIEKWAPEAVMAIPMHPEKLRKRGYNQSQILAEIMGEELGLPVAGGQLKKVRVTKDQKELSHRQRRRNLRGAFQVTEPIPWKSILLVDDVYTTGSTMDAAAEALRAAGVEKIFFATISIGEGVS